MTITPKGYVVRRHNGRKRMWHDVVWEEANGPIPDGMQVHHKNEDKQDNRLENLELLNPLTHKRLHSGCELRDCIWWKECHECHKMLPITEEHWYFGKSGEREGELCYSHCRPCHIRIVVQRKINKRNAAKSAA